MRYGFLNLRVVILLERDNIVRVGDLIHWSMATLHVYYKPINVHFIPGFNFSSLVQGPAPSETFSHGLKLQICIKIWPFLLLSLPQLFSSSTIAIYQACIYLYHKG